MAGPALDFSDLVPASGQPQPQKPAAPKGNPGALDFSDLMPPLPDVARHGADWRAAKQEIDTLPEGRREEARKLWADKLVETERSAGGVMQRVDDGIRRFAGAVPGVGAWADEANAALGMVGGQDYTMRLAYEQAKDRAINKPGATTKLFTTPSTEIAGVKIGGDVEAGDLEKAAGFVAGAVRMPQLALAKGVGFLPGAINAGVNGLLYGGVEAAGNAQPGERIADGTEAGIKSAVVATPIGGVIGKVVKKAAVAKPMPRMSVDDLEQVASTHYDRANATNLIFNRTGMERLSREVRQEVGNLGYLKELHPRIAPVLNLIDEWADPANGMRLVGLQKLDNLRKVAQKAGDPMDPRQKPLVNAIIDKIDDFVTNARPHEIAAGHANHRRAVDEITTARDYWHRARKVENVEADLQMAIDRASSTGVGGNLTNAVRQNLRKTLDQPKRQRGLDPDEIAAYREIVRSSPTDNALRLMSGLSPTRGAISQAFGYGTAGVSLATMNPIFMIPPALGYVAQKLSNAKVIRDTNRLADLVGSPQHLRRFDQWQRIAQQLERNPAMLNTFKTASRGLAQVIADETNSDPTDIYTELLQSIYARTAAEAPKP